jgi:hypothetical protein
MRSVTERRVPTVWIILFALIGIAASVALGRAITFPALGDVSWLR